MLNDYHSLTPKAYAVVAQGATEPPHTGCYNLHDERGSYLCRRCGLALFRSDYKFIASCGWPSFDDELPNAIERLPDADGQRTEIRCQRCQGHLGHVFHNEGYTANNLRHCVNSLAIDFVNDETVLDSQEAIFAGGCFWGVDYYFRQIAGVLKVESGYTGGHQSNPSYQDVCQGNTGHVEAVRVLYNPDQTDYQTLAQCFFEIHDPTQADGQGVDIGQQYLSKIFYLNQEQKDIAQQLIDYLKQQGLDVVTTVQPASAFWVAEQEHQDFYQKQGKQPQCHQRMKRF